MAGTPSAGAGYDISVATSTPTNSNTGGSDFIITGGGSSSGSKGLLEQLGGSLPKVSTDKAWIVWVAVAAVVGVVIFAALKLFRH